MDRPTRSPSVAELAAQTPDDRDRTVDFVRAASILVVVLGHWLIASVFWRDGEPTFQNALGLVPGLWIATWLLQVMPLFFVVGGFSNLVSYASAERRGGGYAEFAASRLTRLMRPTAVFAIAWLVASSALLAAGVRASLVESITKAVAQPLWFLGIYVLVVALAPPMLALHSRFGWGVPVALAAAATVVDVLFRAADVPVVGYLNYGFVWLFAHQLGFFWSRVSRRRLPIAAVAALAVLAVLTLTGLYPRSMVGLPGESASNMTPPSVCIVALTIWQTALVLLVRPRAERWLSRRRPWTLTIAANGVIMTLFLWHLSALGMFVAAGYPLGFPQPETGTSAWWALRPVWIAALAALLVPLVLVFGRFERPASRPAGVATGTPLAAAAMVLAGAGILGFAVAGFSPLGSGRLVVVPIATPVVVVLLGGAALCLFALGRTRRRADGS